MHYCAQSHIYVIGKIIKMKDGRDIILVHRNGRKLITRLNFYVHSCHSSHPIVQYVLIILGLKLSVTEQNSSGLLT